MNALKTLHETLKPIAARYTSEGAEVFPSYCRQASLTVLGNEVEPVKAALIRICTDADQLKAELPGRKITVHRVRGFRVWRTYSDGGFHNGYKAEVRIEMTKAESDGVSDGTAAGLH